MRGCTHQPNLFPRLKVLQKLVLAQHWIVLDDVQYVQREWQNRCLVTGLRASRSFYYTVAVNRPFGRSTQIRDTRVDSRFSLTKTIGTFEAAYRGSKHWAQVRAVLDAIPAHPTSLMEVSLASTDALLGAVELRVERVFSSSFSTAGRGSDRIVELCKAAGVREYITGTGGLRYLQLERFASSGLSVAVQDWSTAPDRDISGLEYLARHGPSEMKSRLLSGQLSILTL